MNTLVKMLSQFVKKMLNTYNQIKRFMMKIIILLSIILANISSTQASVITGTCGSGLTWSLNTKDSTLTIEGSGNMATYEDSSNKRAPWYEYKTYIAYINFPAGLRNIGNTAFYYCENLKTVNIPNTVTKIGRRAFDCCYSLISVNIPNSVTTIEGMAFRDCHKLYSVVIPNSVTILEGSAFYACTNLTSVTISQSITNIEDFTFRICTHLKNIEIPDNVTSIGQEAFHRCLELESVVIGNSIRSVGKEAFSECDKLKSITCKATTPPSCGSDPFKYITNIKSIKLYVPEESVETYSNALWWEDLTILPIGAEQEAIGNINVNITHPQKILKDGQIVIEQGNKIYTLQGQKVQ